MKKVLDVKQIAVTKANYTTRLILLDSQGGVWEMMNYGNEWLSPTKLNTDVP